MDILLLERSLKDISNTRELNMIADIIIILHIVFTKGIARKYLQVFRFYFFFFFVFFYKLKVLTARRHYEVRQTRPSQVTQYDYSEETFNVSNITKLYNIHLTSNY